jgi:AcrR family transcriptional regulator
MVYTIWCIPGSRPKVKKRWYGAAHVATPSRPLSRDAIVRLAMQIADGEGLGAVSFRRLAEHFRVTPMALYHHVENKADLLASMSELFLSEVVVPPRSRDWVRELRELLVSFVDARTRHPSGPDLVQSAPYDSPHAQRLYGATLEILSRAGFESADAVRILQQLSALLLTRSPMVPAAGPSAWNALGDVGVDLLVLGVEALARRQKKKPRRSG